MYSSFGGVLIETQKRAVRFSFFVCFSQTTRCVLSVYSVRTQRVHNWYIHNPRTRTTIRTAQSTYDRTGTQAPPPAEKCIYIIPSSITLPIRLIRSSTVSLLPTVCYCGRVTDSYRGVPFWVTARFTKFIRFTKITPFGLPGLSGPSDRFV